MAAFTTINTGTDWTAKAIPDEYRKAYSERDKAIGGSWRKWTGSWGVGDGTSGDEITAGTDIQAKVFWATIQQWCETNCTAFIDTTETIGGDSTTDWTDFNFADATAMWAAISGKTGFRRSTNGTTFTTEGVMQVGDVIGKWIFEDLAAAFGVLIKIGKQGSWDWQGGSTENEHEPGAGVDPPDDYAGAYAAISWPTSSTFKSIGITTEPEQYSWGVADESIDIPGYDDSVALVGSIVNDAKFTVIADIDGDVDTYIFVEKSDRYGGYSWAPHSGGFTQNVWNAASLADSFTSTTSAYSDTIGDLTTKPSAATYRHTVDGVKEYGDDGWRAADVFGVISYDFSHA